MFDEAKETAMKLCVHQIKKCRKNLIIYQFIEYSGRLKIVRKERLETI